MARHMIGSSWSLDLPDAFQRRLQDHQVQFYTPGRTVYAVAYPTRADTAEGALADFLQDHQVKPLETYSRREAGLVAEAFLLQETHPDTERAYLSLITWTATESSVACVTFYFEEEGELEWALNAWRSIGPS